MLPSGSESKIVIRALRAGNESQESTDSKQGYEEEINKIGWRRIFQRSLV